MWIHGQTVAQKRKRSLNTHVLSVLCGRLGKAVPILSGGFCICRAATVLIFLSASPCEHSSAGERSRSGFTSRTQGS